ncbi:hypothetical protein BS78_10G014400 [Paspalum vaginatum]|nr:hypothetical protein BS78_10G014400 [Paspalum vaginatum]
MAYVLLLSVSLVLCLLSGVSSSSIVHAAAAAAAAEEHAGYTLVVISSLKQKADCSGHRVSPPQNRTWVPLSLSHGPCSSSSSAALPGREKKPSLAELLRQDQLRVDSILMALSGSDDYADEKAKKHAAKSTTTLMQHGPVVDVNVGSASSISSSSIDPMASGGGSSSRRRRSMPGVTQTMMVDTASDVPWVQCHPKATAAGSGSFFDPTRSRTYAAIPCGSPACARLGPYANGCVNGRCQYRVAYPDGSSTLGTYSSDLLTITPSDAVSGFQFGCSQAETGSFDARSSGIVALGGGAESLLSQTAASHGNAFSYCVPPTPSDAGFFVLGAPTTAAATSGFVATPMTRFPRSSTFYRVVLRDITVAGRRLNVPAAALAAGAVMDSRTAITRLPPTAYGALRAAFRRRMAAYRLAPPRGALDTCYDFTGVAVVRVPRVALVFDRSAAAVELDPSGILFNDCLAFASNGADSAPGIIGNVQQQTMEVLYNVGGGAVGFRRGAC